MKVSQVVVIGGGPAGLMAAEVLAQAGLQVDLFDAMPFPGRKFLIAGKGGLNLTHSEEFTQFITRYGVCSPQLTPFLRAFGPGELRAWFEELGFETYVGSSGRVFPRVMRAGPILQTWLARLRNMEVCFHLKHRWLGWNEAGALRFDTPKGEVLVGAEATILALGGGSWRRLGSTGDWVSVLEAKGVRVVKLRPANCGFDVRWSDGFRQRFAGYPVKTVVMNFQPSGGILRSQRGELVVSQYGIEGSLVYAFSSVLRDAIEHHGPATITLDLAPDWTIEKLTERLSQPRGKRTLSSFLERSAGLKGVKTGLLRESCSPEIFSDPLRLAALIKHIPLVLTSPRPIDEAISTAGGVDFNDLDPYLMLHQLPGVFCAGEMLDWEAPTGGYLLTACFSTGRAAGLGVLAWLKHKNPDLQTHI